MTSSSIRSRPRRATSHIWVRLAHTLVGAVAGVVWLVLPWMTINNDVPVPATRATPQGASAAAAARDETSASDLVLPLAVVVVVVVLAGYGYVRRTRRARTRTTPGGTVALAPPAAGPLSEDDERARAALVEADDCVRTSREELGFAEAQCGADAVEPFALAVRDAASELSAAFRMRQQYDEGVPADETSRRHALAGIVGRCREAGRRLDTEAPAFDLLRTPLHGSLNEALQPAEARFRDLTARTAAAQTTLADAVERYGHAATAAVTGHLEQAKDRLVFATVNFNQARQRADAGDAEGAARHLRAAEGATAQAGVLVSCVERLSADLTAAAELVPDVLSAAEGELAGVEGVGVRGAGASAQGVGAQGAGGQGAGAKATGGQGSGGQGPGVQEAGTQGPGEQAAGAQEAGGQGADAQGTGWREAGARGLGVQEAAQHAGAQGAGDRGADAQGSGAQRDGQEPGARGSSGQGTGWQDSGVRDLGAPGADAQDAGRRAAAVQGADGQDAQGAAPGLTPGELHSLAAHAGIVLAAVREEVALGAYDPLDAVRKITQALAPVAAGRGGALSVGALLAARSAVALADGFVAAHRGALGSTARTRLAEAERLLAAEPPDPHTADALARQALALAEQDVRMYGNPIAGAAEHASGAAGAVVGGILLGGGPDGGPPASFGGPRTRARRGKPPG
ncbi:hypothetical protein JYK17_15350 [Streptomyces sp. KC 17012]|uniref:hypothetical protein n=1 Tax=Streptomyces plumbidurans TaxID=2814589 RepID=UPI001C9D7A9C|nr:hypothetical protein [Streptomyces plumbidurans]MBY8341405.1 hypothetical protein [Streptomyces plumbidurans]